MTSAYDMQRGFKLVETPPGLKNVILKKKQVPAIAKNFSSQSSKDLALYYGPDLLRQKSYEDIAKRVLDDVNKASSNHEIDKLFKKLNIYQKISTYTYFVELSQAYPKDSLGDKLKYLKKIFGNDAELKYVNKLFSKTRLIIANQIKDHVDNFAFAEQKNLFAKEPGKPYSNLIWSKAHKLSKLENIREALSFKDQLNFFSKLAFKVGDKFVPHYHIYQESLDHKYIAAESRTHLEDKSIEGSGDTFGLRIAPFFKGENLQDSAHRFCYYPSVLRHIAEAMEACDYVHQQSRFHGDIKLSNILIKSSLPNNYAKLADFETSMPLGEEQNQESFIAIYNPKSYFGLNKEYSGKQIDKFAFGAMLYTVFLGVDNLHKGLDEWFYRSGHGLLLNKPGRIEPRVKSNFCDFIKAKLNDYPRQNLMPRDLILKLMTLEDDNFTLADAAKELRAFAQKLRPAGAKD